MMVGLGHTLYNLLRPIGRKAERAVGDRVADVAIPFYLYNTLAGNPVMHQAMETFTVTEGLATGSVQQTLRHEFQAIMAKEADDLGTRSLASSTVHFAPDLPFHGGGGADNLLSKDAKRLPSAAAKMLKEKDKLVNRIEKAIELNKHL
jgi:hypothetical protein